MDSPRNPPREGPIFLVLCLWVKERCHAMQSHRERNCRGSTHLLHSDRLIKGDIIQAALRGKDVDIYEKTGYKNIKLFEPYCSTQHLTIEMMVCVCVMQFCHCIFIFTPRSIHLICDAYGPI